LPPLQPLRPSFAVAATTADSHQTQRTKTGESSLPSLSGTAGGAAQSAEAVAFTTQRNLTLASPNATSLPSSSSPLSPSSLSTTLINNDFDPSNFFTVIDACHAPRKFHVSSAEKVDTAAASDRPNGGGTLKKRGRSGSSTVEVVEGVWRGCLGLTRSTSSTSSSSGQTIYNTGGKANTNGKTTENKRSRRRTSGNDILNSKSNLNLNLNLKSNLKLPLSPGALSTVAVVPIYLEPSLILPHLAASAAASSSSSSSFFFPALQERGKTSAARFEISRQEWIEVRAHPAPFIFLLLFLM
jgi:hypothetical protein